MFGKKELALRRDSGDPFALLRKMTAEFERTFDDPFWPTFRRPFHGMTVPETVAWSPKVDVFEKDHRLFTRFDLPGVKKENIKVEVADGQLVVSGTRANEAEEKKENVYRIERESGAFFRTFPLPEGATFDDVKATFENGVLEVSVPLPVRNEPKVRTVEIEEGVKNVKTAA